jgi:hypothetical protein
MCYPGIQKVLSLISAVNITSDRDKVDAKNNLITKILIK